MLSALLIALLSQEPAVTAEAPPPVASAPARVTGGVFAPASLPAGSNALYGFVGAPDLGVGYRQGFGSVEFEARALFNLFEVSAIVEVGMKLAVYEKDKLKIAPGLALGFEFDAGARYIDRYNFAFVGIRPRLSAVASYSFSDTITGLAMVELPVSIAFAQGFQITPLLGAGAEFHLGGSFSLLVSGHGGFDATREPLGVTQYRGAWAARLGIGYRLF
ncbi:MAG: hypothetical protein QM817_13880 [Archangium sp.]